MSMKSEGSLTGFSELWTKTATVLGTFLKLKKCSTRLVLLKVESEGLSDQAHKKLKIKLLVHSTKWMKTVMVRSASRNSSIISYKAFAQQTTIIKVTKNKPLKKVMFP